MSPCSQGSAWVSRGNVTRSTRCASRLGREHDDRLADTAHALLVGVITRMLDQDAPWSLGHAADVVAAGWT